MASSSLPAVNLMHPTLVARPFHRAGWIYEEKVDGWRMVAIKGKDAVRLVSRKGNDLTTRFPELVKALSGLKPRAFIPRRRGGRIRSRVHLAVRVAAPLAHR